MINTKTLVAGLGRWVESLRARQMWRTAVAILLAQMVYWFLIQPFLLGSPARPELYEIVNQRAARLSEPTAEALANAPYESVEAPWWDCCNGYFAYAADWELDTVPPEGLALIPLVNADNTRVYVNGNLVHLKGQIRYPDLTHEQLRTVLFVSPGLLHTGVNTVEFILAREALPYVDVNGQPLIGEFHLLSEVFAKRMFLFNEYPPMAYAIGFALALIAFVVMLRADRRGFPFWMGTLALGWSLLAHFYEIEEPLFGAQWKIMYYFALTALLPVAWLNLANEWTGRPWRWVPWVSIPLWLANIAANAWLWFNLPQPDSFDRVSELTNYMGIAFSLLAILRFLWHMLREPDDRHLEVGVFTLCISLIAVDRWWELTAGVAKGNIQETTPLLLLALALAYLARNVRLFQSLGTYNTELQAKVALREAELEVAHSRERELVRREAHDEERRRIMADMHDGLGSQLMSMLLAARRNALPGERMAEGLQAVMDEMRLILDSMDSVGESLTSALVMFRTSTERRVHEAGLAFHWQEAPDLPLPQLGPRAVLNVFRILQEAVNNALRHAAASTIVVSIAPSEADANRLRIEIADDGRGLQEANEQGRGLNNMRSRAAQLGATFTLIPGSPGTRVQLDLPQTAGMQA